MEIFITREEKKEAIIEDIKEKELEVIELQKELDIINNEEMIYNKAKCIIADDYTSQKSIDDIINFLKHDSSVINIIAAGYNLNDDGHKLDHAFNVYDNAVKYMKHFYINEEISSIFKAALMHDMFASNRDKHHEMAYNFVDKNLIGLESVKIAYACLEHRSSGSGEYYSNLSKLIAMGDNGYFIGEDIQKIANEFFNGFHQRMLSYYKKLKPKAKNVEIDNDVAIFIKKKYGSNGYAYNSMAKEQRELPCFDVVRKMVDEF